MSHRYSPVSQKVPRILHGADYNPEQWLNYPDILAEDIRLMKVAQCNVMSLGIFSWASLEPSEGMFTFDWLDQTLDVLWKNGLHAWLGTPSGARPAWLAKKYPEVLRVGPNRVRNLFGGRHNHCYSSPVYRKKVATIDGKLAERYGHHPAVIGWHVSNEYGGDCHCDYCQAAFRDWLLLKYQSLDELNRAWWTTFWSHTYTNWSQIESPAPHGETMVHAMNLDWQRFVTDRTVDFLEQEMVSLRAANADLPITTNLMEAYSGLNYWKVAKVLDVVSWDSYPTWHDVQDDSAQAAWVSMIHDMKRSMKGGRPFILMESTPSATNWQSVSKLKRPGMHLLSALQAIAHGADGVQYFQWRKSRGASEKFHGAVIDHSGHEKTRVFNDVMAVGDALGKLSEVVGTTVQPQVAIIFDWENRWAIQDARGPRNVGMRYEETVKRWYRPFWNQSVPVDVIDMVQDFSPYKLLVAPMLYMVRPGVAERIAAFVENGGTLIATYWSGIVDENDLCFLGGFPGPLRKTLGIWSEEIDALHDGETNGIVTVKGNRLGLQDAYEVEELCDLIHLEGAEGLAFYQADFYASRPALTCNRLGKGKAYYVASRNKEPFYGDFIRGLIKTENIARVLGAELPYGVTAQVRSDGEHDYVFVMNFSQAEQTMSLLHEECIDLLTGEHPGTELKLRAYQASVLKRKHR